jgi:hypothetical protein
MTNLTPSERIRLRDVKSKFSERSERDQPDPTVISDALDDDGMVTRVRGLTWEETLAVLTRDVGEVDAT